MKPDQTLQRIEELGLLAVVRGESRAAALEVVGALIEGGVLGIEITFTTPEAPQVIRDLNAEYGDRILLGGKGNIRPLLHPRTSPLRCSPKFASGHLGWHHLSVGRGATC